jgi:hypothetical protein
MAANHAPTGHCPPRLRELIERGAAQVAKDGKRRIWGGLDGSLESAFDEPVVDFAPADHATSSSVSSLSSPRT